MNELERGATSSQLDAAVAGARILFDAYQQCAVNAWLQMDALLIEVDSYKADRYFLTVNAPLPTGKHDRDGWHIDISRWDVDLDDPEHEGDTATADLVLRCALPAPPTIRELVELMDQSDGPPGPLVAWADTPVGDALAGTTFVVTERHDASTAAMRSI